MTRAEYAQLPWSTAFESSNIARIAWVADEAEGDADAGELPFGDLYVEFAHGGAYRYLAVPCQTHTELLEADSVGGYLNQHIKPYHDCERIHLED